ncbi:MAG: NADPH-dependent FMN reductase [Steroidobacteraceae bacterium]
MSGPRVLQILGIAGSLRRDSYNRRLLAAAAARAPGELSISIYQELESIPLFNEDLEVHGGPEPVTRLRAAIARSDAILIATPEYNQSLPGVVKNLVDWLSRGDAEVLDGKPAGILGVTAGPWGTRLAQAALRQTLTACGALIMPQPQFYLADAGKVFDAEGRLADERVGARLEGFLGKLNDWSRRTGAG